MMKEWIIIGLMILSLVGTITAVVIIVKTEKTLNKAIKIIERRD